MRPFALTERESTRFERLVERVPGAECWFWMGATNGKKDGAYGVFNLRGRQITAHRLSWQAAKQVEMDPAHDACHTCDIRLCVNPLHIWPGTRQQNLADARAKGRMILPGRRSHCARGHALVEGNLRIRERPGAAGIKRECLTCLREGNRVRSRVRRARRFQ